MGKKNFEIILIGEPILYRKLGKEYGKVEREYIFDYRNLDKETIRTFGPKIKDRIKEYLHKVEKVNFNSETGKYENLDKKIEISKKFLKPAFRIKEIRNTHFFPEGRNGVEISWPLDAEYLD